MRYFRKFTWGGGGTLCPPLSWIGLTDLKLSHNLNELVCEQIYLSTASARPWLPQQRPKLTHVFERHISAVFMQKLTALHFWCCFHEECPKCNPLWNFRLDSPLDGNLVTIFVSNSLQCFNNLKFGNTMSMETRMVSFDLVFYKFLEKLRILLLTFNWGTRFLILTRDSESKF